jgi:hypothetical protein
MTAVMIDGKQGGCEVEGTSSAAGFEAQKIFHLDCCHGNRLEFGQTMNLMLEKFIS